MDAIIIALLVVSIGLSAAALGVASAWPTTRHARRSDTPSRWRTKATACRRRGGLRSFPRPPL